MEIGIIRWFFFNVGFINQFASFCPTTCVQVIAVYYDDSL